MLIITISLPTTKLILHWRHTYHGMAAADLSPTKNHSGQNTSESNLRRDSKLWPRRSPCWTWCTESYNDIFMGRFCTVDLLELTRYDQLIFILKILFTFVTKQAILSLPCSLTFWYLWEQGWSQPKCSPGFKFTLPNYIRQVWKNTKTVYQLE
jgi:hypothetical protein